MKDFDKAWEKVMLYGSKLGCHQLPERSFFFRGYQFPVCARCTGLILGYMIGLLLFPWFNIPIHRVWVVCVPLILDGVTQYIKWRKSNQFLRLVTGILCGFGIIDMEIRLVLTLYQMIVRR